MNTYIHLLYMEHTLLHECVVCSVSTWRVLKCLETNKQTNNHQTGVKKMEQDCEGKKSPERFMMWWKERKEDLKRNINCKKKKNKRKKKPCFRRDGVNWRVWWNHRSVWQLILLNLNKESEKKNCLTLRSVFSAKAEGLIIHSCWGGPDDLPSLTPDNSYN